MKRIFALIGVALLAFPVTGRGQSDTLKNQLSIGLNLLTHGEVQGGGLPRSTTEVVGSEAGFLLGRTRLNVGYARPYMEVKAVLQNNAIWGMKGNTSLNLYEGWVKFKSPVGFFAQAGRVALSYDDERIIGTNDFAMAALSHDILRAGYEGHGHSAHAIFAFNQNGENVYTNTYYINGAQYYKTMQVLWYHYDIPKFPLGASLLFMNLGMQAGDLENTTNPPRVVWQQMAGGYLKYSPDFLTLEASYYHQWGTFVTADMLTPPIDAWMASAKASLKLVKNWTFTLGYDFLSGDDYVPVVYGGFGLVRHEIWKGFTPLTGSRTKFYGLLDYFYQSAHTNGFSPGLQNAFIEVNWKPGEKLSIGAAYHFLATGTKLREMDSTLGHDIDLSAGYRFSKYVAIQVGYTHMFGTETMNRLKQGSGTSQAQWGWFSLVVNPELFSTRW